MLPMTLAESGHSNGTVSLSALFEGSFESGPVETSLDVLALAKEEGYELSDASSV